MCQRAEVELVARPESLALGRHFITRTLSSWGVVEPDPAWRATDDLRLVGTELLGNAVQASSNPIALSVEAHRDRIHVGVRDDDPQPAVVRRAARESPGGRGLVLVAFLSDAWGQTPFDGTKKWVWAEVPIGTGSILTESCRQ